VAVTVVLALLHGGEEIDGTKKDLSEKPEFCHCCGWRSSTIPSRTITGDLLQDSVTMSSDQQASWGFLVRESSFLP
jgi:hypothetical protein